MRAKADRYRLYGLILRSDLPLGGPRARAGRTDLELLAARDRWPADCLDSSQRRQWFASRHLSDGSLYLRWRGLFEFLIAPGGRTIRWRKLGRTAEESFRSYLLGQVLSFALLARGREPLHASAVAVGGRVIAFLGDCGLGKSSLAAAFVAAGYPLVTDDLLVLEESRNAYLVQPGLPRIKLYPRIARRLLGVRRQGPRLNPGTAKLIVPLPEGRTARRPLPLDTLYVLARARSVRIAPLSGASAMLEILRATFNTVETGRERAARHFAFARKLAGAVRMRRLAYPRRLAAIGAVRDAVLADLLAPASAISRAGAPLRAAG